MRIFDVRAATAAGPSALVIGITGPSGSGKTYSGLRLATGMQRVLGGEIFVIDTEARRAMHYANKFKFQHLDFEPPFGPLDYRDAINTCVERGAKIIVIDSMSHEHNGEGGVMDRVEEYLAAKAGDDWKRREALTRVAHIAPKRERRILNQHIVQLGRSVIFILCYRAHEKVSIPDKAKGETEVTKAWTPETTSTLVYDMTQRFLLKPGGDGTPNVAPTDPAERLLVKSPEQFRGWIKSEPLTEDLGEKLARWAQGGAGANVPAKPIVCFRANVTWELGATWSRKPIADAPLDALVLYREALASALAKTDKQAARDIISADLEAIDEAMAAKEPQL